MLYVLLLLCTHIGGEALAELLREKTCHLNLLKLDWNMLRLNGAIDFCNSLQMNSSLTYLDLSYNALSRDGGIALGNSLLTNTTLNTILLEENNIDA